MNTPLAHRSLATRWLPRGTLLTALASTWLLVCTAVLIASLWLYAPGARSDALVLFAWAMVALSFPTGLSVSVVLAVVLVAADALNANPGTSMPWWLGTLLVWLAYCVAGYFQWFMALPWLWQRYRAASVSTESSPQHVPR